MSSVPHNHVIMYRPEVDGLRAIAVMTVILFHAGFNWLSGGFLGVDVFFVISGYLITGILVAEVESGRFSLAGFYERRARRILPALVLVVSMSLPFAWFLLAPDDLVRFARSVASIFVFSSNIQFFRESGYFDAAAETKPMLHTWSLAVEEQYYVLFPLLLLLLRRLDWRLLLPAVTGLLVLSLVGAEWLSRHYPAASFFLLPSRAWELMLGALVAILLRRPHVSFWRAGWRGEVGGAAGLLMIVVSMFVIDDGSRHPGFITLLPALGAALLIFFSSASTLTGRLLAARVPVFLGLISYSAYLWHQPVFAFYRHAFDQAPSSGVALLLISGVLVLAYLTYRWIETPFRRKSLFSRRQVLTAAAVVSAAFVLLGVAGVAGRGFSFMRLDADGMHWMTSLQSSPEREACHTNAGESLAPSAACVYLVPDARWAVLGDSHGVELAYALATRLQAKGIGLKHLTYSGCVPAYGRQDEAVRCADWTTRSVGYLKSTPAIDTVVVTYRLNAALFGNHDGSYPHLPDRVGEVERARRWSALRDMLAELSAAGKRVVFVMQAPELPRPMSTLIFRHRGGDIKGVSPEWWARRGEYVNSRLGELPAGVKLVDPALLLCDLKTCRAGVAGISYYFDDNHLSLSGAGLVADQILSVADPLVP